MAALVKKNIKHSIWWPNFVLNESSINIVCAFILKKLDDTIVSDIVL